MGIVHTLIKLIRRWCHALFSKVLVLLLNVVIYALRSLAMLVRILSKIAMKLVIVVVLLASLWLL